MAKILIADDSNAAANQLRSILEKAGHQVIRASSGQQAVEMSRTETPAAVFMDVVMENMDGFRATREILEHATTKDLPIIMVTSKKQKADKVWAQLQGAKGYITKPYTDQQILDELNKVL